MARSRSAAFSLRVSASLCSSVTTCPVLAERNAAPATPAAASSAENPPAYTTMAPASGMTALRSAVLPVPGAASPRLRDHRHQALEILPQPLERADLPHPVINAVLIRPCHDLRGTGDDLAAIASIDEDEPAAGPGLFRGEVHGVPAGGEQLPVMQVPGPGPAGALVAGQDVIPAGAGVGLGHGLRGLEVEERFHPAVPGDRRVIGGVRGRELRDVQVLVRRDGAVEEPDPGRRRQMGLVRYKPHLPQPPGVRFFNGSDAPDKNLNIPQFSTTYATDDTSIARHGRMESFLNLESAQPMSEADARARGDYILSRYQRASWAGPWNLHHGQLLTTGGHPVNLATEQARTCCRLILVDGGYGGEVIPGAPKIVTGAYQYSVDDGVGQVSALQRLRQDFESLMSVITQTRGRGAGDWQHR